MRYPYRPPRCEGHLEERRRYLTFLFDDGPRRLAVSTTHTCGLRKGHKGKHNCRKHTCGAQW